MNTSDLSYGKLPWIPAGTAFAAALLLDFIPLPAASFFWLPKFSAIVLIFFCIYRPQTFGLFCAFILGLIVDAGTATPLGQHALAYVTGIFLLQHPAFSGKMTSPMRQFFGVFLILLLIQAVLLLVFAAGQRRLSHEEILLAAPSGALLWPLAEKILKNFFSRFTR